MARANGATEKDVAAQLDALKQDIAGLNDIVKKLAEEKVSDARKEGSRMASEVENAAREAGERVRAGADKAVAQVEDSVRRQPAVSMGVAAGLGFLVGYMSARRG